MPWRRGSGQNERSLPGPGRARNTVRATNGGMRPLVWLRACVLVSVVGLACSSPTLPLPPPALPSVSLGSEPNRYVLRSDRGAIPNALVIAVNRNESLPSPQRVSGTLANEVGSYEMLVTGSAGDVLDLAQQEGTTQSPTITVELK